MPTTPYDFVKQVDVVKASGVEFWLHPDSWGKCSIKKPLVWQEVQFLKSEKPNVPAARGVYIFIVKPTGSYLPPHGYLMYIGITGDTATDRNLRVRYGDYLRDQQVCKRPAIHYLLNKWKRNVFFCFAEVPDQRVSLGRLERLMNDAFMPPCSKNDFTAEVRKRLAAFL